jgi:hypothetical protein
MSYDLNFWKYKKDVNDDHQSVYERLSEGEHIEGLEELPIADMLDRVKEEFSIGWEKKDGSTWESEEKAFSIFTTPQFFRVDCYGLEGEDMNIFIDIMYEFGCPLYDPQVGQRYEG